MRKQYNWLEVAAAAALGFWLCVVLIWMWPAPGLEQPDHAANHSTEEYPRHHEIHKTFAEWLSGVAHHTSEDPVALYTFVLVVFTGLLGFATVRLWFVTKALVDGADNTATRQLRAYITVKEVKIEIEERAPEGDYDLGQVAKVSIIWQNNGQTPATNVVVVSNETVTAIVPDDFYMRDNEDNREEKRRSVTVVGPHQGFHLSHVLRQHEVESFGQRPFYIWGWVEYDDAFAPDTPRRRTEMCTRLVHVGRTFKSGEGAIGFSGEAIILGSVSHENHNAMDEGCYRPIQTPRRG